MEHSQTMSNDLASIEFVTPATRTTEPRFAFFDFDGTVSLIREGWQQIMTTMMVDELLALETDESSDELNAIVSDYVMELTGKPTIYQMIRFVEELERRGDAAHDAQAYCDRFQAELGDRIDARKEALRDKSHDPEQHLVPGVRKVLEDLKRRGVVLYLASGTDEEFVRDEVGLLGLSEFFEDRIFGSPKDYRGFSKDKVIAGLLQEHRIDGDELVGFGDGVVETVSVKTANGLAIGVAGDEAKRDGLIDAWKRDRLVEAGADLILADFRVYEKFTGWLFNE